MFEDPPGFRYELAADIALQADGTIVVTGEAIPELEQDYVPVLARYTPEGALDKTLAGTGITASPACIRSTCWCARLARSRGRKRR